MGDRLWFEIDSLVNTIVTAFRKVLILSRNFPYSRKRIKSFVKERAVRRDTRIQICKRVLQKNNE